MLAMYKNELTIKGNKTDVDACLAAIAGTPDAYGVTTCFDFDRIVPMPQCLYGTANLTRGGAALLGNDTVAKELLLEAWAVDAGIVSISQLRKALWTEDQERDGMAHRWEAAYKETGYYDAYSWREKHWGTGQPAFWPCIEREEEGAVIYAYTALSPATEVVRALGRQLPRLVFHLWYTGTDSEGLLVLSGDTVFTDGSGDRDTGGDWFVIPETDKYYVTSKDDEKDGFDWTSP